MRLNVTMMRDALKCPTLGYNLHVLRRGPLTTPVALEEGTLFHEGMEARMANVPVLPHELPSWGEVGQKARDNFNKHKLWVPLNAWAADPNWEIHGIEMRVERRIAPDLLLEGKLDGFVIWQNKLWDLQWKTYTDDLQNLIDKVRLSWHEVGYQWMAEGQASLPWGGTILGACQKLPSYRMVEGADGKKHKEEVTDLQRELAFSMHFITRSPQLQKEMVHQLIDTALEMQTKLEIRTPLRRNYDACFTPWGGRCPFFSVCHEGENIYGPEFRTLENRYAQREEGEGAGPTEGGAL